MTSLKQIEANRRNALRSTGPITDEGKQRASQNAVRHGLTAETVILPLEDADDYQAFEQAVTADYDAETAVERELVLRLASLLWRLRRATSIETGLFRVEHLPRQDAVSRQDTEENQGCAVTALFQPCQPVGKFGERGSKGDMPPSLDIGFEVARRFVRLADLDNGVFERLSRYEAALWRQVRQTLFTLEALRWRTSNLRKSRPQYFWPRTAD
jgi:hypothetical protein